jgi:hypothetical protein
MPSGEEPVAVARAAHALHDFPAASRERELQAGLAMAVLLPAAGLPMTMYQGSSYSAAVPDFWPNLDVLMVLIASSMRWRRAEHVVALDLVAADGGDCVACFSSASSSLLASATCLCA